MNKIIRKFYLMSLAELTDFEIIYEHLKEIFQSPYLIKNNFSIEEINSLNQDLGFNILLYQLENIEKLQKINELLNIKKSDFNIQLEDVEALEYRNKVEALCDFYNNDYDVDISKEDFLNLLKKEKYLYNIHSLVEKYSINSLELFETLETKLFNQEYIYDKNNAAYDRIIFEKVHQSFHKYEGFIQKYLNGLPLESIKNYSSFIKEHMTSLEFSNPEVIDDVLDMIHGPINRNNAPIIKINTQNSKSILNVLEHKNISSPLPFDLDKILSPMVCLTKFNSVLNDLFDPIEFKNNKETIFNHIKNKDIFFHEKIDIPNDCWNFFHEDIEVYEIILKNNVLKKIDIQHHVLLLEQLIKDRKKQLKIEDFSILENLLKNPLNEFNVKNHNKLFNGLDYHNIEQVDREKLQSVKASYLYLVLEGILSKNEDNLLVILNTMLEKNPNIKTNIEYFQQHCYHPSLAISFLKSHHQLDNILNTPQLKFMNQIHEYNEMIDEYAIKCFANLKNCPDKLFNQWYHQFIKKDLSRFFIESNEKNKFFEKIFFSNNHQNELFHLFNKRMNLQKKILPINVSKEFLEKMHIELSFVESFQKGKYHRLSQSIKEPFFIDLPHFKIPQNSPFSIYSLLNFQTPSNSFSIDFNSDHKKIQKLIQTEEFEKILDYIDEQKLIKNQEFAKMTLLDHNFEKLFHAIIKKHPLDIEDNKRMNKFIEKITLEMLSDDQFIISYQNTLNVLFKNNTYIFDDIFCIEDNSFRLLKDQYLYFLIKDIEQDNFFDFRKQKDILLEKVLSSREDDFLFIEKVFSKFNHEEKIKIIKKFIQHQDLLKNLINQSNDIQHQILSNLSEKEIEFVLKAAPDLLSFIEYPIIKINSTDTMRSICTYYENKSRHIDFLNLLHPDSLNKVFPFLIQEFPHIIISHSDLILTIEQKIDVLQWMETEKVELEHYHLTTKQILDITQVKTLSNAVYFMYMTQCLTQIESSFSINEPIIIKEKYISGFIDYIDNIKSMTMIHSLLSLDFPGELILSPLLEKRLDLYLINATPNMLEHFKDHISFIDDKKLIDTSSQVLLIHGFKQDIGDLISDKIIQSKNKENIEELLSLYESQNFCIDSIQKMKLALEEIFVLSKIDTTSAHVVNKKVKKV